MARDQEVWGEQLRSLGLFGSEEAEVGPCGCHAAPPSQGEWRLWALLMSAGLKGAAIRHRRCSAVGLGWVLLCGTGLAPGPRGFPLAWDVAWLYFCASSNRESRLALKILFYCRCTFVIWSLTSGKCGLKTLKHPLFIIMYCLFFYRSWKLVQGNEAEQICS